MRKACQKCNEIYDYDTKSVMCPHVDFPKPCKIHNIMHCDNPDCRAKVFAFRITAEDEKEIKYG